MLTVLRILAGVAAAMVLGAVWLLRPLPLHDLASTPDPARTYEEAMARWERTQSKEAALPLHEGGRTIVLTHGHETERVFVLLHG